MCHMLFLKYDIPTMGLGLVDVVDVDEHDFEASDISETIPNNFDETRCRASTGCLRRPKSASKCSVFFFKVTELISDF